MKTVELVGGPGHGRLLRLPEWRRTVLVASHEPLGGLSEIHRYAETDPGLVFMPSGGGPLTNDRLQPTETAAMLESSLRPVLTTLYFAADEKAARRAGHEDFQIARDADPADPTNRFYHYLGDAKALRAWANPTADPRLRAVWVEGWQQNTNYTPEFIEEAKRRGLAPEA